MALEELHIHRFRNIHSEKLSFSPTLNLIFGANGSGKTSLLEAIYYLSSAQSFRTSKHRRVVQEGSDTLTLFGKVVATEGHSRLGVERNPRRREVVLHKNGIRVRSIGELARLMPVSVIEPGTFELVGGGPGYRRRFLDWLVFHVEHDYGQLWKECQRAIRQRNLSLRHGTIHDQDIGPWSRQAAHLGEEVTRLRESGFNLFYDELKAVLERNDASWTRDLTMDFVKGWDSNRSLASVLRDNLPSEQRAGFTLYGPNRADIRIRCGDMPAGEVLSRGQQRSLVILMKLAQLRALGQTRRVQGVCLLDDINAELDIDNQRALADELLSLGCQLFVTSINEPEKDWLWSSLNSDDYRMFHVEHGQFAEQ